MAAQPPLLARCGEEESLGRDDEEEARTGGRRLERGVGGGGSASRAAGAGALRVGDRSSQRRNESNASPVVRMRPLRPSSLPALSPLRPGSVETLRSGPIILFFLCFFRNEQKIAKQVYKLKNAYIYAICLPKIKVGRPPYLALSGASPL